MVLGTKATISPFSVSNRAIPRPPKAILEMTTSRSSPRLNEAFFKASNLDAKERIIWRIWDFGRPLPKDRQYYKKDADANN
jgi:hypothetical protein